ncbi:hypothetical protein BH09VER1_BH09VER1_12120 [soil metagenome]
MKTKLNYLVVALAATLFTGTSAFAISTGALDVLRTVEQAKALPKDATVVLACGSCQTIQVVKPGGILGLFTPGTKHECPGCKGQVTQVGAPGKTQSGLIYTHTCSKCGNASAYVCAGHRS